VTGGGGGKYGNRRNNRNKGVFLFSLVPSASGLSVTAWGEDWTREKCHRRGESSVIVAARAVSSSRREQCHRRGESSVIVAARAVSSSRRDQCHRRGKLGQVAVLYPQIVQDKQGAILYWYGTLLYCKLLDLDNKQVPHTV
jgi:hypothetical protein